MPSRHFIQHIGGDPIALRFVKYDPKTNGPAMSEVEGQWVAEWTEDPADRAEWETSGEAGHVKQQLGMGLVRHTDPDPPKSVDEERPPRARDLPDITNEPIPDRDLPWWQK